MESKEFVKFMLDNKPYKVSKFLPTDNLSHIRLVLKLDGSIVFMQDNNKIDELYEPTTTLN